MPHLAWIKGLWAARWQVLAASLAVAVAVQTLRLGSALDALTAADAVQEAAAATSEVRGLQTGIEETRTFEDTVDENRPVVERVVERVVRQCAPRDPPVPERPSRTDAAAAAAGNHAADRNAFAGERAFALAVAVDLESCAVELERFRALQRWVLRNGG
ncbi:hypothetical protein JN531_012705 [Flagellatimonas centrodinii]|uniref:hypothetical protein n=1 Tax=Flagellatimonas centrodinii TaxID=2806210 RepID=UPI001FFD0AD1|nr:hypothetical protein [Flagellatimonas centrodinii]ULQ45960.1 hypothetical protein JN531_012705 [Flagellatimonas centrodinii]